MEVVMVVRGGGEVLWVMVGDDGGDRCRWVVM